MRFATLATALCLLAASAATSTWAAPAPTAGWVLTPDGLGPLKIGMTPGQARAALGRPIETDPAFDDSCRQYNVTGLEGLSLLFQHGRLNSIGVNDALPWRTAAGIGLGDTEQAVRKAYGPGLKRENNAYDEAPAAYLTVRGPHGHGIKFTTDTHRKVLTIDVGGASIAYSEGCS
jgi:hypothetical protein